MARRVADPTRGKPFDFQLHHFPPRHTDSLVQGTVMDLLKDHLIVHPLALWYFMPKLLDLGWLLPLSAPLPSITELSWQLPAFLFINDTLFYWVHRTMVSQGSDWKSHTARKRMHARIYSYT